MKSETIKRDFTKCATISWETKKKWYYQHITMTKSDIFLGKIETIRDIRDNLKASRKSLHSPGDCFTKVIVNRKSKITPKISLRVRICAFH